jgi:hypothetical protein
MYTVEEERRKTQEVSDYVRVFYTVSAYICSGFSVLRIGLDMILRIGLDEKERFEREDFEMEPNLNFQRLQLFKQRSNRLVPPRLVLHLRVF